MNSWVMTVQMLTSFRFSHPCFCTWLDVHSPDLPTSPLFLWRFSVEHPRPQNRQIAAFWLHSKRYDFFFKHESVSYRSFFGNKKNNLKSKCGKGSNEKSVHYRNQAKIPTFSQIFSIFHNSVAKMKKNTKQTSFPQRNTKHKTPPSFQLWEDDILRAGTWPFAFALHKPHGLTEVRRKICII